MSAVWLGPSAVTPAQVRRLPGVVVEEGAPVQRVDVPLVPAAHAVPRQVEPADLRLPSRQQEDDPVRAEVEHLRD